MRPYTEINCLSWNDYFWKLVRRIASPGLQNMHVFKNIVPQMVAMERGCHDNILSKNDKLANLQICAKFIKVPSTSLKIIRKIHSSINNRKMSLMHQSTGGLVVLYPSITIIFFLTDQRKHAHLFNNAFKPRACVTAIYRNGMTVYKLVINLRILVI